MHAIRSRLAAIVASYLLTLIASWGVTEVTPELAASVQQWAAHTFEVFFIIGYAVVHPWIQRYLNPTGAFDQEVARQLTTAAGSLGNGRLGR